MFTLMAAFLQIKYVCSQYNTAVLTHGESIVREAGPHLVLPVHLLLAADRMFYEVYCLKQ